MSTNTKPLCDWTLGEVETECRSRDNCCECRLYDNGDCRLHTLTPSEWDLTEKPRFTEDEVAALRVLHQAGIDSVERKEYLDGDTKLVAWDGGRGSHLPEKMFPSIHLGQYIAIQDIIKNEKEK